MWEIEDWWGRGVRQLNAAYSGAAETKDLDPEPLPPGFPRFLQAQGHPGRAHCATRTQKTDLGTLQTAPCLLLLSINLHSASLCPVCELPSPTLQQLRDRCPCSPVLCNRRLGLPFARAGGWKAGTASEWGQTPHGRAVIPATPTLRPSSLGTIGWARQPRHAGRILCQSGPLFCCCTAPGHTRCTERPAAARTRRVQQHRHVCPPVTHLQTAQHSQGSWQFHPPALSHSPLVQWLGVCLMHAGSPPCSSTVQQAAAASLPDAPYQTAAARAVLKVSGRPSSQGPKRLAGLSPHSQQPPLQQLDGLPSSSASSRH